MQIFISKENEKVLIDDEVFENIANIYEKKGQIIFRQSTKILGKKYDSKGHKLKILLKYGLIVDQHIHFFKKRADLKWPASVS